MVEVEVRDVRKRFGGVPALEGFSSRFREGEITAVLGPSGGGKTTLLRVIAGLERPDSGEVLFDGIDVGGLRPWERNVGMVFQTLALFPHMTALENVAFGLEERGIPEGEARRRALEVMRIFRIDDLARRYPHQLSGGQRQRVALARAVAPEPAVLLLDEPFGSLDMRLREELLWELRRIHADLGFTAVHVTHDQFEALALADRLVLIRAGRNVREGRPDEVVARPGSRFAAEFLGANVAVLEEESPGRYRLSGWEIGYRAGLGRLEVAFYPEDSEPCYGEGGVIGKVVAYAHARRGYLVSVEVEGEEFKVAWPEIPGERISFRPRRYSILDGSLSFSP